ncbi:hypothetical protein, partial [Prevotella pectinovora]|uniref:hypothetical protein n=1 Tax=Prevotella pectinovora TaxID=1602169 RepID=UPI00307D7D54
FVGGLTLRNFGGAKLRITSSGFSPLSFSPVGEMQVTLVIDKSLTIRRLQTTINSQRYLSLPFGGG